MWSPPPGSARIVGVAVSVWAALQLVGLVVGLTLVGRNGGGPARHVDVPVHDWFIQHRTGLVGVSKVLAFVFDAPMLGLIVVVGTAGVVALMWSRRRFDWAVFVPLVAYLGAEATVYVVRIVIHRPRPGSADFPGPDALAGIHETSWSFPSGHATASMAVLVACAGLVAVHRRAPVAWIVAVVLALCVSASRLVLGVHWFTDVTSGAVLGAAWGATVCWALLQIRRSRSREPVRELR